MSLKNVGTTFRATVAILAISLFTLVSDATAQVFCSASWTTACASVTVDVRPGSDFSETTANWVLVISVTNISFNPDPLLDPFMDVESSVIRQLLFRITDGAATLRAPTLDFWVRDENGVDVTSLWALTKDGDFNKIGATYTQDVTNDDGACRGIVVDLTAPNLPCGPGGDHRTLAVFHLAFDDVPLVLEAFAAQFVNMDAASCHPPAMDPADPYCESDWATNVIPEPMTMTLVGTGLVGIGLARRRRRLGLDIVED